MPRGLDHVVHAVRDLDAAAAFYARAGFMVGARNRHPWGTHNRIVQLRNAYIELLEIAEPEKIVPHAPRRFSFGAFHRDLVARQEGFSMLLLKTADAAADARSFAEAGIGDFDVFAFSREGLRPDGTPVKLAFSLAFAADPLSPDCGFGVCQHHFPENFWSADAQRHDNGARGVAGVVLTAENPADHHIFLGAWTGVRDLHATSMGVTAAAGDCEIAIVEPEAFRSRYGEMPAISGEGARIVAMRIAVDDSAVVAGLLGRNGLAFADRTGEIVVGPTHAHGATLIFAAASEG